MLKAHPILKEHFVLFDYSEYNNVIVPGKYSYPFTLYLPEWLPQSLLCINTPDPKKPGMLNTFKIRYDLIAAIEKHSADAIVETEKQGPTMTEL